MWKGHSIMWKIFGSALIAVGLFLSPVVEAEVRAVLFSDASHGPDRGVYEQAASHQPHFAMQLGDFPHAHPSDPARMQDLQDNMTLCLTEVGCAWATWIAPLPWWHIPDDHDTGADNSDRTWYEANPWVISTFKLLYPSNYPGAGWWHGFRWDIVEVVLLDTRSERDPPDTPDGQIIGPDQEAWLVTTLQASSARWVLIASSVPFNRTSKPRDGWGLHPTHGARIEALLISLCQGRCLIVSGDIHSGGACDSGVTAGLPECSIPHTNLQAVGTCSSGLCGTWSLGFTPRSAGPGYGLLRATQNKLILEMRDAHGTVRHRLELP